MTEDIAKIRASALKSIPMPIVRVLVETRELVWRDIKSIAKNGPTCEWNSCEFLHSEEHSEKESADIITLKKDIEHRLNSTEPQIIRSNEYHKAHTEAIVDNIMKVVNKKLEVIEEEYSSKFEQLENPASYDKSREKLAERNRFRKPNWEIIKSIKKTCRSRKHNQPYWENKWNQERYDRIQEQNWYGI